MMKMNRMTLESELDFLVWRQGSGDTVEVFDIAVGTERRRGKGRRLVDTLLRLLAERRVSRKINMVWAVTRDGNHIAKEFWAGIGFRTVGVLIDFYGAGDHGVMFGLNVWLGCVSEDALQG